MKTDFGKLCLIAGSLLVVAQCGDDAGTGSVILPDPIVRMQSHTDCKTFADRLIIDMPHLTRDCFVYEYDGGSVLHITRTNAAFNCCPDSLTADATITQSTIIIEEIEWVTTPCDCLCLYDMEFEITNVRPGIVKLRFMESYLAPGATLLQATIDLIKQPSGAFCANREFYPWSSQRFDAVELKSDLPAAD